MVVANGPDRRIGKGKMAVLVEVLVRWSTDNKFVLLEQFSSWLPGYRRIDFFFLIPMGERQEPNEDQVLEITKEELPVGGCVLGCGVCVPWRLWFE